jgi:BirA family transcriptional regulator, biotin operon repressor / biotin---[acetyl-CoA-carboxylase] ligase
MIVLAPRKVPKVLIYGAVRTLSVNLGSMTDDEGKAHGTMVHMENTQFFVHDEVTSTQDICKNMIKNASNASDVSDASLLTPELEHMFCVLAKAQNAGRGSRGRTWTGLEGNLFLTIAIKQSCIPCPLTLIPLRVGTLVFPHIRSRVVSGCTSTTDDDGLKAIPKTYLKWPNDILIGTEKVCGTIVEIENGYVLVGIGCNVAKAPDVPTSGPNAGRVATCIASYNEAIAADSKAAISLAADITKDFRQWASLGAESDPAERIVIEFTDQMDKTNLLRLRSGPDIGKEVIPLYLNIDGTLQVRMADTGEQITLMAEYLF